MKYLLALLLTFGIVGSAHGVDECFTGSWYDPASADSRGIDIQVLPTGVVAGYFYTWYDTNRELFLIIGPNDSDTQINLRGHQSLFGGTAEVGTATIDIIDNDHMIFSHNWKYDHHNTDNTMRWCFAQCTAVYEYTRLTQPIPCEK
jgi:hypothetical protein